MPRDEDSKDCGLHQLLYWSKDFPYVMKKIDGLYTTVETELPRTEYGFHGNTVNPNHDCYFDMSYFYFALGLFFPFLGFQS